MACDMTGIMLTIPNIIVVLVIMAIIMQGGFQET